MKGSLPNPPVVSSLVFLMLAVSGPAGRAGTVAAPYQAGTWEGFRPAAISYTFDDDCANQYAVAAPMFHAAGLKMTLFTVTSWEGSWALVKNDAAWGDEIASHTVTHPDLTTVPFAQLTNELANSQSTINSYITNESCLTLAYPDCTVPSESITALYYIAARGCSGQLVSSTPADFLNISSFVLGNTGSYTTATNINRLADNAVTANAWCVYLIHGIDSDGGYSPLSSTVLQACVNYTSTNQGKFWVETFGNVVRYIKERNALSVAEITNSGGSITLQVTHNLNTNIYNQPITLRRPMPANWPGIVASTNGHPVNLQFVTVNSTNYVMFDVVPNAGNVVLMETVPPFTLSSPAPASPGSFTFQLNGQSNVTYTICSSPDLVNWLPCQTNTLTGPWANITVGVASNAVQYYRAEWQP
jgi:oligosaccharide reducing-end xylanase